MLVKILEDISKCFFMVGLWELFRFRGWLAPDAGLDYFYIAVGGWIITVALTVLVRLTIAKTYP